MPGTPVRWVRSRATNGGLARTRVGLEGEGMYLVGAFFSLKSTKGTAGGMRDARLHETTSVNHSRDPKRRPRYEQP